MANEVENTTAKTDKAKRRAIATKKLRLVWGAERVFLAWIRTAIALMALGFLVARLGGLLQVLGIRKEDSYMTPVEAMLAGTLLIGLGGAISIISTWRFRETHHNISQGKTYHHSAHLSLIVGVLTALVSIALIVSLCAVAFR